MISKKRTDFEYKIHRQTKCKEDYLSYIAYECILLQDIKRRRRELSVKDKKADIEYSLAKRVRRLFKELVKRFPSDLELWLGYIIFCKNVDFSPCITAIFEEMLQVHGDKARVWQLACRWEYNEMHSIDTARTFAVKGLQRHPMCKELYLDAFRMELLSAENMDVDTKEIQLKRAKIFVKSALQNTSDVSLVVDLCSIANNFDFAESLQDELFSELWNNHSEEKEAWEFVAQCELEGKSTWDFDWKSLKDDFFLRKCPDKLANFYNVFETSVKKIPSADACNSYINSTIKSITGNSEDTIIKLQVLRRALSKGHMLGQLTEQQYKLWIDLLDSDKGTTEEEISKVLKEACVTLPNSEYIWKERLERNKKSPVELIKIFKEAEAALPSEKGTMLWVILLENTKDLNKLKKCFQDTLRLSSVISKNLRPLFLQKIYELGDISEAREQYAEIVKIPPFELDFHKKMLEIEGLQKVFNYKKAKTCYEIATHQFGKNDPDVWLDYIKFESSHGHPEHCGPLYNRACSTLDRECVDKFIVLYSLNKN